MNPLHRSLPSPTVSTSSLVSLSSSLSLSSPLPSISSDHSSDQSSYSDSMDSDFCGKSETSTPSSSPNSDDNFDYPPIDFAILEHKLAALGLSRYTVYPSALKGRRSLNSQSSYSSSEEDDDEVFMIISRKNDKKQIRRPPMVRSKSLKTGKTPPETPKKKMVRFADALGLEFETIRLISQDELPIIPKSAYQHLKLSEAEEKNFTSVIF